MILVASFGDDNIITVTVIVPADCKHQLAMFSKQAGASLHVYEFLRIRSERKQLADANLIRMHVFTAWLILFH